MFYLCRLYIYQRESVDKPEIEREILLEQFSVMTRRLLYGITWPSAVLTWVFGLWLLTYYLPLPAWLWIKLGLVILLTFYHYSLYQIYLHHKCGKFSFSSNQLRMWNEVPTVFLISIVMLVVVKQGISLLYGLAGLFVFIAMLLFAIKIYAKFRKEGSPS